MSLNSFTTSLISRSISLEINNLIDEICSGSSYVVRFESNLRASSDDLFVVLLSSTSSGIKT